MEEGEVEKGHLSLTLNKQSGKTHFVSCFPSALTLCISNIVYSLSHNQCTFNSLFIPNISSSLFALLLDHLITNYISIFNVTVACDDSIDTGHLLVSTVWYSIPRNFTPPSREACSSSCMVYQSCVTFVEICNVWPSVKIGLVDYSRWKGWKICVCDGSHRWCCYPHTLETPSL